MVVVSPRAQTLPETNLWQSVEQSLKGRPQSETWIRPDAFRSFQLQHSRLRPLLGRAPKESSQTIASSGAVISLPMPDGTQARFRFVESPVMHPDLAARFPEIKTYRGQGIDDPAATVRFDLTPVGFHAQILSPQGAVYVEPYLRGNTNLHAVYARRDYQASAPDFQCLTSSSVAAAATAALGGPAGGLQRQSADLPPGVRSDRRIHGVFWRECVGGPGGHCHGHQPGERRL